MVAGMNVPDQLLADIKTAINITWSDTHTDERISGFIADGMAYLNEKLGSPVNYLVAGEPRTLLKEYVRYARDEAQDVFEENYRSRIIGAQNSKKVSDAIEKAFQTECGCYAEL